MIGTINRLCITLLFVLLSLLTPVLVGCSLVYAEYEYTVKVWVPEGGPVPKAPANVRIVWHDGTIARTLNPAVGEPVLDFPIDLREGSVQHFEFREFCGFDEIDTGRSWPSKGFTVEISMDGCAFWTAHYGKGDWKLNQIDMILLQPTGNGLASTRVSGYP